MNVSILAAGAQDRFGGDLPKGLSRVTSNDDPSDTIIGRLIAYRDCSVHINLVVNIKNLSKFLGFKFNKKMLKWPRFYAGNTFVLGPSLSAAIQTYDGMHANTIVLSADTVMTREVDQAVFCEFNTTFALFDPYKWITIEYVTDEDCLRYKQQALAWKGDRIEWISQFYSDIRLVRYEGWWNVNTLEDLDEARDGLSRHE